MPNKKRQPDFHKTKLKPGRIVAGRRNITSTKFKAKKLEIRKKPSSSKESDSSGKSILALMKQLKETTSPHIRLATVRYLKEQCDVAHAQEFYNEHLFPVLRLPLACDHNLRTCVIELICQLLSVTDTSLLQSYVDHFTSVLNCMTHADIKVKECSMNLLQALLKYHPDLICRSMVIPNNLLQMMLGIRTTARSTVQVTKINKSLIPMMIYSDDIYSPDWRIYILAHLNWFLREAPKESAAVSTYEEALDSDNQQVYYDSRKSLYVPIYARGGIRPVDIEKVLLERARGDRLGVGSKNEILTFVNGILQILPEMFDETMSDISGDEFLLPNQVINNLSKIFETLSLLTEWKDLLTKEMEELQITFLKKVFGKYRLPFQQKGKEKLALNSVQLNMTVCYLFSTYLFNSCKEDFDKKVMKYVFDYIEYIFDISTEIRFQSIPMLVRTMEGFLCKLNSLDKSAKDLLYTNISKLCSLLEQMDDNPNRKILVSFFTMLCLNLEKGYCNFVKKKSEILSLWFSWLLNKLTDMVRTSTIDKKLFRTACNIAKYDYPCFQEILEKFDFGYMFELLNFDDEDIRQTSIYLILSKKSLDYNYLSDIFDFLVQNSTFPKKFASRLIRLLSCRLTEALDENLPEYNELLQRKMKNMVELSRFLLHIAIDVNNIKRDEFIDFEANDYTQAVKVIRDAVPFCIIPSLHWKEHSLLFEASLLAMGKLHSSLMKSVAMDFLSDLLASIQVLPMHSTIAILKIHFALGLEYEKYAYDLIFSAYLTMSTLNYNDFAQGDWYKYNVEVLDDTIKLNPADNNALHVLFTAHALTGYEGIVAFLILKVIRCFLARGWLHDNHLRLVESLLKIIKTNCLDKEIESQYLFESVYDHVTKLG